MENKINKKELDINKQLRREESRTIQLYKSLKKFVRKLKTEKVLKDHNFDEYFYGYRAPYDWDSTYAPELFKTHWLGTLDLYMKDKEYRDYWNREYIDSRQGLLSPIWKGADKIMNRSPELILSLDKIELVICVEYQVLINTSSIAKSKKMSNAQKVKALDAAMVAPLQKLQNIIAVEQRESAHLSKMGLFDKVRISGDICFFSNNHKVNDSHSVLRGDPYFETTIDWSVLDNLDSISIANLKNRSRLPSLKHLGKTNSIWLEYQVEYVIQVSLS